MIIEVEAEGPRQPTKKQLDFIEEIVDVIGEDFEGDTFDEASDWISEHIDEFRELKEHETDYSPTQWYGWEEDML